MIPMENIARRLAIILLLGVLLAPGAARAASNLAQINDTTGWKIFEPASDYDYRYGPSIIINADNSIDMWMSSPGAVGGAWDSIRYRHSTDGGHTWTADQVVLNPTSGGEDTYSCCDPGVIKIGSYYYIGYTSTNSMVGANHLFIARSASPAGPYDKWNGRGWGGSPKPIIDSLYGTAAFGLGEPSFVLKDGKLYIYYTDADLYYNYTALATCDNPTLDDWPATLTPKGRIWSKANGEDSLDIKYVDSLNRFVGVMVRHRMAANASVAMIQSDDGLHWQPAAFKGNTIKYGSHNIGISGTSDGHLDTSKSNFIAYSVWPSSGYVWGKWPTWLDPITLGTTGFGTPLTVETSTAIEGWDNPKLCDGDVNSIWSSTAHATSGATEWGYVDLGANFSVTRMDLWPRPGGYCFPVDFTLDYSADGANWTTISGQSYTNYPNPGSNVVSKTFGAVMGRYFRVNATKLGFDGAYYYLQLAEIGIVATAPSLPGSFNLSSPANGATGQGVQPSLSWNAASGATSYRLTVADNANLDKPVFVKDGLTGTSYWLNSTQFASTVVLDDNKTYYWKVEAYSGAGYTACGATFSFTTAATHVSYCDNDKATASSYYDANWVPGNAIDFNNATCWSAVGYTDPNHTEWISVNTGAVSQISEVHLMPRSDGANFPVDFKIQYGLDGASWTDVPGQSYTNYPAPGGTLQPFFFASPVTAQYIRIYVTKLRQDGGSYWVQLAEVDPVRKVSAAAADAFSSRTGGSASSALWPAASAWDGDPATCWSSNYHASATATEWLSVNTGALNRIKGVTVVPRPGAYCYPVDFKFQSSPDGSTWTDVPGASYSAHARPGSPSLTFTPTYTFASVVKAQYLRLYATRLSPDDSGTNYYCQLAEIKPVLYSETNPLPCARFDTHTTASTQLAGMGSTLVADGSATSCWSSVAHGSANYTETVQLDLGGHMMVKRVRLMPRTISGTTYCFPSVFRIEFSSDNQNWATFPEMTFSNFANPAAEEQVFTLRNPVTAGFIRLVATSLRPDQFNNYYCQIGEFNADEH